MKDTSRESELWKDFKKSITPIIEDKVSQEDEDTLYFYFDVMCTIAEDFADQETAELKEEIKRLKEELDIQEKIQTIEGATEYLESEGINVEEVVSRGMREINRIKQIMDLQSELSELKKELESKTELIEKIELEINWSDNPIDTILRNIEELLKENQ